MNLLVKKLKVPGVVLLASLFFVSCEDPGKIGLNINPEGGSINTKYKEFVLPSTQVQFNPRSTVNSFSLQAGTYSDLDFGTVTSESYTWLGVQPTVPTLSATAAYGSISMSIQFSSIYGSEAEEMEFEPFEVYQLADPIVSGVDYTRVDKIALGPLIGNLDILIMEDDTLQIDSLFSFALSDAFGQAIFDKLAANDGTFNNDTVFNEFFKGIAIVSGSGNNKIVNFNPATFRIILDYNETNSAGEIIGRTYSFDLGNMRFFHLNSDLGGTPLSGILPDNQDFTPSNDFRYVQSGTMIALKVDFDSMYMFIDSIDQIVIQKAFLSIGSIPDNPPGADFTNSLIGYFTDENNLWPALSENPALNEGASFVALQEEFTTFQSPVYPGYYGNPQNILRGQVDELTYEATMSNFIQNFHDGGYNTDKTPYEQKGKMLLFAFATILRPQSSPSYVFTDYFKVHKDSIKVKLYYSVPN